MNKILIPIAALIILLGSGCSSERGKTLDDFEDMTAVDSLVYYYGMLRAYKYYQLSVADTNLRHLDSKERYLKGIRDGINMITDDDEIYNQGVREGMRMALRIDRFEEDYDTKLDTKYLLSAVCHGILDADTVNLAQTQHEYYTLLNKLNVHREQLERANARLMLSEIAQKRGMKRINDLLYSKVLKEGSGLPVDSGATIDVDIKYMHTDGESLGMPNPEEVTVGRESMQPVMCDIFMTMKQGETALFATSAEELLGQRAEIINLQLDDIILLQITVNKVMPPAASSTPAK